MAKALRIEVKGVPVTLIRKGEAIFISLTDMAGNFEGGHSLIEKWLQHRTTLDFLAAWERLYNPAFNTPGFESAREMTGLAPSTLSVKQWLLKTGAVGLFLKTGRQGGTFAHSDIAFEAASWLNGEFKMLLLRAFQRFESEKAHAFSKNWDLQRLLSKLNYKMQARAIKESILPQLSVPKGEEGPVYAEEGDMLNLALFGKTSQQWKEENPALARKGLNIRDTADLPQLTVLSNLAGYNALLIQQGLPKEKRLSILQGAAAMQLQFLYDVPAFWPHKTQSPHVKEAA